MEVLKGWDGITRTGEGLKSGDIGKDLQELPKGLAIGWNLKNDIGTDFSEP